MSELKDWLKTNSLQVKQALLVGDYMPSAVRKVEMPKQNGVVRTLGMATVVDRLIQQALHQVLQPIFEPTFSESSYGFRPMAFGRGAVPTRPRKRHVGMRHKTGAGWLIWIWRSSLIASTMTFLCHGWRTRSGTARC